MAYPRLLLTLVCGSLIGASTILALGRIGTDSPPIRDVRDDIPVTFEYQSSDPPGAYRIERGWFCDFDITTHTTAATARATCTRDETP